MNIPEDLKYTKDHEWIRVQGNEAFVGVTDYAQGELGDVVFIEIETIGKMLDQGDVFGTIEAVKTVSDMFMPVSGKVIEVNSKLEESPELVNKEPYNNGWMMKMAVDSSKIQMELNELLTPKQYSDIIGH